MSTSQCHLITVRQSIQHLFILLNKLPPKKYEIHCCLFKELKIGTGTFIMSPIKVSAFHLFLFFFFNIRWWNKDEKQHNYTALEAAAHSCVYFQEAKAVEVSAYSAAVCHAGLVLKKP